VALHHLAGDLDVDGVDVVEQAGGEEAADLEDEPGEYEDGEGAGAPAAEGGGLRWGFLHSFLIIVAIIVAINFGGASGLCGFVEEG
jgi:hypothetical protein